MDRRQCKNFSNNLKNNMITPEPSEHTTGRLEHPNQEIEKIDIMKVIESLKQDVKNSLKEMGEKNYKIFEEMNKSVKDTLGNPRKNNQTDNGNSSRLEN